MKIADLSNREELTGLAFARVASSRLGNEVDDGNLEPRARIIFIYDGTRRDGLRIADDAVVDDSDRE